MTDQDQFKEIKNSDHSWWLKYLEETSNFDAKRIKAQMDWLIQTVENQQKQIEEGHAWLQGYFELQNRITVLEKELAQEKQEKFELYQQISAEKLYKNGLKKRIEEWRGNE